MKSIKFIALIVATISISYSATAITITSTETSTSNALQPNHSQMQVIKAFITNKYPNSIIIDIDSDNYNTEVEIIHNQTEKDVLFDSDGNWIKSKWEIYKSALPTVVLKAIKSSPFSSYSIDDIDFYETHKETFYVVELEKFFGDRETTLYITPEGKIM